MMIPTLILFLSSEVASDVLRSQRSHASVRGHWAQVFRKYL